MLRDDPQALFDRFVTQAKSYLDSPGVMAALELDATCGMLYPVVARILGNNGLSNLIREFGRNLPRKEAAELRDTLNVILAEARAAGIAIPD